MTTPAERLATYEDLCQVPDTKVAQIIHGHWLVDPGLRTLEVFSLRDTCWQLECAFNSEDRVCAPPFQAVTFNLGGLWP